eukprot:222584-Karenia_brevis.AAC.1
MAFVLDRIIDLLILTECIDITCAATSLDLSPTVYPGLGMGGELDTWNVCTHKFLSRAYNIAQAAV